jgi:hypothetical protein
MTYDWVCNKGNTTDATCGAGYTYPSGAPELIPVLSGIRVAQFLVFCVVFVDHCCPYVLFLLFIVFLSLIWLLITPFAHLWYPLSSFFIKKGYGCQ